MRAGAVTIRAEGGRDGSGWTGCVEIPTPAGGVRICARVEDADVRALARGVASLHRALHAADPMLRADTARAARAALEARGGAPEIGFLPIIAALAIPLITAGVQQGLATTDPRRMTGAPSGVFRTTFNSNPLDEIPRPSGPSVEEVRAYWSALGADAPDVVEPAGTEEGAGGRIYRPERRYINQQRVRRDGDLEWLGVYQRGYTGRLFNTAAEVPAEFRNAWNAAREASVPLWRAIGLAAAPASPVPMGTQLVGSSLGPGGYTAAPASWSAPSTGAQDAALAALTALASGAASAAGGGLSGAQALAALGPALGSVLGAAAQGDPQAGRLAQLAVQLALAGGGAAIQSAQRDAEAAAAAAARLQGGAGQAAGAQGLAALFGAARGAAGAGGASGASSGAAGAAGGAAGLLGGLLAQGRPGALAQLGAFAGGAGAPAGLSSVLGATGLAAAAQRAAPQLGAFGQAAQLGDGIMGRGATGAPQLELPNFGSGAGWSGGASLLRSLGLRL